MRVQEGIAMSGDSPTSSAPVAVLLLHPGDKIHVQPHQVFRHTQFIHDVPCREADVQVDCLLEVGAVIVICWGKCSGTCGAVVYDADDTVQRLEAAPQDASVVAA